MIGLAYRSFTLKMFSIIALCWQSPSNIHPLHLLTDFKFSSEIILCYVSCNIVLGKSFFHVLVLMSFQFDSPIRLFRAVSLWSWPHGTEILSIVCFILFGWTCHIWLPMFNFLDSLSIKKVLCSLSHLLELYHYWKNEPSFK